MTTFGQRVRGLRRDHSQDWLGKQVGLTRAAISFWENGTTAPENIAHNQIVRAAEALGTSAEYLLTGKGAASPARIVVQARAVSGMADEADFDEREGVMLPVYDMDVSAGPGRIVAEFAETRKKVHFARSWLRQMGVKEADVKIVKVRGESMQPTLYDDDDIMLNTKATRIRDGRVFALGYAGETRVKRLYQMAGGRLRVTSDNPDKARYPDEIIEGEALNDVLVIGQVIHKMGGGGL